MLVSDRVMNGDFAADYNPFNATWSTVDEPPPTVSTETAIGLTATRITNSLVYQDVTRRERFKVTTDAKENQRLQQALKESFKR
jgi:hypothetical protein